MKNMKVVINSMLLCCLIVAGSSYASFIQVNGTTVEVLNLNTTGSSSFVDFYDRYNGSSHTGYEQENKGIMFFGELGGETALIITLNKFGVGSASNATLTYSGTEGEITYIDDVDETVGTNFINWNSSAERSDGAIYSGFTSDIWALDLDFEAITGIIGFTFLTQFDGNGLATDSIEGSFPSASFNIFSTSNNPSSIVSAPAPASISLLGIALILLTSRRFLK
jgi:hypothetical protein